MTGKESIKPEAVPRTVGHRTEGRCRGGWRWFCCAAWSAAAVLFLLFPTTAADGVRAGLQLCAGSLIPSLFPFLAAAPMLTWGLYRFVFSVCSHFGVPGYAAPIASFTVGMAAGFPLGAVSLASQCEAGILDSDDAGRLLGICIGASPAFLVGYFGAGLWNSTALGWAMWGIQTLVCAAGLILLLPSLSCCKTAVSAERNTPPGIAESLRSAVPRMLAICGTVLFFSVLRSLFCRFLPVGAAVMLGGLVEMTGGIRECAALRDSGLSGVMLSAVCSAWMIGFGGLCVGMQTQDAVSRAGISITRYYPQRLLIGTLCALLFAGLIKIGMR